MPLPSELSKIKATIEDRRRTTDRLSVDERALLDELKQLDQHLSRQMLNEMRTGVTKMTSPGGDRCGCCGRPY